MKKGEFINISKKMVVEYFNRYVVKDDIPKVCFYDVSVFAFHETEYNWRILLSTPKSYGIYYEVSYDKRTKEIHSYPYKKVGTKRDERKTKYIRKNNRFFNGRV